MNVLRLTAVIEREGDGFVALCPEIDVASQGNTKDEARANLREAVELYFESASPEEIRARLPAEISIEPLEVTVG
jgi:predicted RNase H-like HicB family nuclease